MRREIFPRGTRSEDPQDRIKDGAVWNARSALAIRPAGWIWKESVNQVPMRVSQLHQTMLMGFHEVRGSSTAPRALLG